MHLALVFMFYKMFFFGLVSCPVGSRGKIKMICFHPQEYTLNKQQVLAIAPVVCAIQDMFEHRSNPMSHIADGSSREKCNCLWLGAGGSGKTWAYTKVIRPLLQRFFGSKGYIVGAPTHAAVRLLGPEARTLHSGPMSTPIRAWTERTSAPPSPRGMPLNRRS